MFPEISNIEGTPAGVGSGAKRTRSHRASPQAASTVTAVEVEIIDPETGEYLGARWEPATGDSSEATSAPAATERPGEPAASASGEASAFARPSGSARIGIVVPLTSLLGLDDRPAELGDRSGCLNRQSTSARDGNRPPVIRRRLRPRAHLRPRSAPAIELHPHQAETRPPPGRVLQARIGIVVPLTSIFGLDDRPAELGDRSGCVPLSWPATSPVNRERCSTGCSPMSGADCWM